MWFSLNYASKKCWVCLICYMLFNVTKVRQLWSKITVILHGGHQKMNVTEMTISLQNWQIVTELIICQFCNIFVNSVTLLSLQNCWICLKFWCVADWKAVLECVWYRHVMQYHKRELVRMSLTVIWYRNASKEC